MDWLLKTEPSTYSFEDLVREKTTTWDGVTNAQARLHLRSMKKGDRLVVYHTGDVKAAVGRATVGAAPRPDPADPKGTVVDVKAGRALKKPVTLAEMKAAKVFAGSPLLTIGRLSVVPLTAEQYAFVVGE
ncbi:MAG: EVE domain-containing protein [Thermoanaerobaculia bacterium]|jgi:predicted RNA-binding protein with PUA-like domain|nr:EVE domain-containing protein [Thermoanaerobaculia bacterium]